MYVVYNNRQLEKQIFTFRNVNINTFIFNLTFKRKSKRDRERQQVASKQKIFVLFSFMKNKEYKCL